MNIPTRRSFLQSASLGLLSAAAINAAKGQSMNAKFFVYVGTYASEQEAGIHVYSFDANNGAFEPIHKISGIKNPSYLTLDPKFRNLYAVSEMSDFNGKKSGAVTSFSIDAKTGSLKPLNQQPSMGQGPCYVSVDNTGQCLLVANYGGGNLASLPIQKDGGLGEPASFFQHEGSSSNPKRQGEPHAHCILATPDNRLALCADLGIDKVMVYKLDPASAKLTPNDPPFAKAKPGAGPRHIAFHPNGKIMYVINELDSTIAAFNYDSANGSFDAFQTANTLPYDFTQPNTCADIHVSPDGKFLYGSNRGHDSLAIFRINSGDGTLSIVGHESTRGKTPRNFNIDPTGAYLIAANQSSSNLVVFKRDQNNGTLSFVSETKVPRPVCIKFMTAI